MEKCSKAVMSMWATAGSGTFLMNGAMSGMTNTASYLATTKNPTSDDVFITFGGGLAGVGGHAAGYSLGASGQLVPKGVSWWTEFNMQSVGNGVGMTPWQIETGSRYQGGK